MYETLTVTHDDGVSTVTLNRPPLNLVSVELLRDLAAAFDALEARAETRCVILTGAGQKAFSAGADLGEEARHDAAAGRSFREAGRRLVERIETYPKPVVTAVRGWCIGGGTGFAWVGDIRIAAESAKFRAGDVYLGIIPTWSMGMVRLVHYLGRNRTLDLLLLGEDVTARQALELGLVSKVFPDEGFEEAVMGVARRLASGAPLSFRAIKECVRAQWRDTSDRAALLEERWAERILDSKDAKEGITAFKEKRKARFEGR